MKKSLAIIAALTVAVPLHAKAADLAVRTPPVTPAAVFNWTGFYLGAAGGYGWGKSQECFAPGGCSNDMNLSGAFGGVTAGYNWQTTNLVLGVEGDWSWGGIKGATTSVPAFNCNSTCNVSVDSFGTLRGRVGYAFDRVLPYLTAGAAFTDTDDIWSKGLVNQSQSHVFNTTFAWGGGIEFAFSPQWSGKIEYVDVGRLPDGFFDKANLCLGAPGCYTHDTRYAFIRLGLNYRFGAN